MFYCRRQRGGAQPSGLETKLTTLWLSRNGRARINEEPPKGEPVFNAIGGHELFLDPDAPPRPDWSRVGPQPSVAVGLQRDGRRLLILVVDGRQPNYSEGVTAQELDAVMRELGAESALALDGGGSATLVAQGPDGRIRVLNSPIDSRMPGRERAVANHLGIFARANTATGQ